MKPLRILVVSSKYPPEYSGSGERAHRTYQRLKAKYNIKFDVLCSSVTANTNADYFHEDVPVRRIAGKLLPQQSFQRGEKKPLLDKIALRVNYLTESLPAFDFLNKNHHLYDVVHVFGNAAVTSAAVTFCNRHRKPLIVEVTYDAKPQHYKPRFMKIFDKESSGFHPQTQFVCISKRLEKICRDSGIEQRIWTRPNPVDTAVFCIDRSRKKEYRATHCRFTPEDIVLVNVSKFMPIKNQAFLIEVLKFLPEKYKLVLAGPLVDEGPNVERDRAFMQLIKDRIWQHQLDQRVQITEGFVPRVDEYMKMADVYVFPSRMEGLGTPMIESICCGVPVVANHIEGVTDAWIEPGKNGFTCRLDAKEFAAKVELAAKIDAGTLERSASQMQSIADINAIDERYYQILQSLTIKGSS